MKTCLALVLTLVMLPGAVVAGSVSPGLKRQMDVMNPDDHIRVLVVMAEQVDVATLDLGLRAAKASLSTRHHLVVDELRTTAARSQRDLLADLAAKASADVVRGFTPHWLVNGVVVATTVAGVAELAARDDVEVVEADLRAELVEPVASASADEAVGVAPGVVAVGARRVWDELGVDGSGALVGVIDTGVQGDHPALSGSWRGNSTPTEECWIDAADLGDVAPVDRHGHGTHVMGTIVGLAPGDTIGVAPGAQWIAANPVYLEAGLQFDNAVLASLEFMTDPDGDPATTDDVPDVVQNSWGVSEENAGYIDCDSRWWNAIDACEAAGVVLTWSAGNEGPDGMTMRSPADRATSAVNCFSVGSTNHTAPYLVSDFSSRGPSGCGGVYAVKPEVVAPGDDIYSADHDGGYRLMSGTSMAGPHVAGVVALMRAANPDLDVVTIKNILMETAVDIGLSGEENDNGHGFIDGFAAVQEALRPHGTLTGVISDGTTGLPLPRAAITLTGSDGQIRRPTTDDEGFFTTMLPAGPWTLAVSCFGYAQASISGIDVAEGAATQQNAAMALAPRADLSGHVRDEAGLPIENAAVTVLDRPLTPAHTDPSGRYVLELPLGYDYDLLAEAAGLGARQQALAAFSGAVELDFVLPEQASDGFESGAFDSYPWYHPDDAPWTVDTADAAEGDRCARSGPITHEQTSALQVEVDVLALGDVSFDFKVSSESGYDFLRYSVDGAEVARWSGERPWTTFSHALTPGPHTLAWSYTKDSLISIGDDAAWVDGIVFPTTSPPLFPLASCSPDTIFEMLVPGTSSVRSMTLANGGDGTLNFNAVVVRPPLQTLSDGGPDEFGYSWIDSDDAGGPAFEWFDLNDLGTHHAFANDESRAFPLGFTFEYYGVAYENVYVSSNGFLSFTSDAAAPGNDPIPGPAGPDALMAAYWDDLNPAIGGAIVTYSDKDRFVAEWRGVPYRDGTLPQTFQIIVRRDGTFSFQYLSVSDRMSATVGIENHAGDDGLEIQFHSPHVGNGMAILFSSTTPWMSVSPASGAVPAGAVGRIDVTFDAADTPAGAYDGYVTVRTNDPDNPEMTVATRLVVAVEVSAQAGAIDADDHRGDVRLSWTYDPSTVDGFHVYRRTEGDVRPVRLTDAPLSDDLGRIEFVDAPADMAAGTVLFYGYGLVIDGVEAAMSPETSVVFGGSTPARYALHANYPNPFNPSTTIAFELPRAGRVRLAVYDIAGRLVRVLIDEVLPAASHTAEWRGLDGHGRPVASGSYFMRLTSGDYGAVRKTTLVR